MGCCKSKAQATESVPRPIKQDKDINDKKMLKVGLDLMGKDFSAQIGYNRIAKKVYGGPRSATRPSDAGPQQNSQENSS